MTTPKEVLFVCVHNSGRSRMAEAFFNQVMKERGITSIRGASAGTQPSDGPNPTVVEAMTEVGLHIPNTAGRLLTSQISANAVKFVSMGCGDADACPVRLRGDMEDWDLPDPKGQSLEAVRGIREDVRTRVEQLVEQVLALNANAGLDR